MIRSYSVDYISIAELCHIPSTGPIADFYS